MRWSGASYAATPRRAAAVFVAFESLTQRTPRSSRTSSRRCGTPGNVRSASAIASSGTPAARAAAVAAAAFSRLWRPGMSGSAGSASSAENSIPSMPEAARHDLRARALEDAELRVAVGLEGAVPVEVVGLEVEEDGDVAGERVDVLELEARELADDPGVRRRDLRRRRQRPADVAGDLDGPAGGAEDRAEQLGRRRLAVRPRDADRARRRREQPVAELDLAPERDAARARAGDERRLRPARQGS